MSGLREFLRSIDPPGRSALAQRAGTTTAYLEQLAGGHRRPGVELSRQLVTAATELGHRLTLNDCRPDIWKDRKAA